MLESVAVDARRIFGIRIPKKGAKQMRKYAVSHQRMPLSLFLRAGCDYPVELPRRLRTVKLRKAQYMFM